MEDPAEIAALAQEFIGTLDNVPQEVDFLLGEIREKDKRIADLLPRIGRFEAQLREVLTKGGNVANEAVALPDADRVKAERLEKKVTDSNSRVVELASQKEDLALQLWRLIHRHTQRLAIERKKIAPHVLEGLVEPSLVPGTSARGTPTPITSIVPSLASAGATQASSAERRKSTAAPPAAAQRPPAAAPTKVRQGTPTSEQGVQGGRANSPSVRMAGRKRPSNMHLASPPPDASTPIAKDTSVAAQASRAGTPTTGRGTTPRERRSTQPGSGSGGVTARPAGVGGQQDGDEDALYCFCQRVSYGEMVGCDGEDCKYEWFHISCVGLSNPLPDTWYCDECKAKLEKDANGPPKKKKKTG